MVVRSVVVRSVVRRLVAGPDESFARRPPGLHRVPVVARRRHLDNTSDLPLRPAARDP
ncbi:hypothetical protein [Kitasatospora sp. NPDC008115]|uniref:hypothetical protein n=1 Tax=Kitasatospora sp. NPDC008115 TaxID=3364022 RepID=UPI0036E781A9